MRLLSIIASITLLAACQDEGAVADDAVAPPPVEVTQAVPGDWSALRHAVGQTPMESGVLEVGPITIDANAMLGEDAPMVRKRLHARAGELTRIDGLLVSVSEPGPKACYLIVDSEQRALEIGWRAEDGSWRTERTAAAEIERPLVVRQLRGEA